MTIRLAIGGLIALSVLLAAPRRGTVVAQYPPPTGSVRVTASSTTVGLGGSVTLDVLVLDANGNPVANQSCVMLISSQPGTDASVTQHSPGTDAAGVITGTLMVGTTPGIVEVEVTCGELSGRVSVVAGEVVEPPVESLVPPPSGFGPGEGGGGGVYTRAAMVLAAVGSAAIVFAVVVGAADRMVRRATRGR